MDVAGDEDGGWAGLARCPYGVQENNCGGRVGKRPHHRGWRCSVSSVCSSTSASSAQLRISQHAYASTGSGDQDLFGMAPVCAWVCVHHVVFLSVFSICA